MTCVVPRTWFSRLSMFSEEDLSRAESSSFALTEMPFSFLEVVNDVIGTFSAKAREKRLELRRRSSPVCRRSLSETRSRCGRS